MKKVIALPTVLLAAVSAHAGLVDFTAQAQVTYVDDSAHHFANVHLGDLLTNHVQFDTANAVDTTTAGTYPDALYHLSNTPSYESVHVGGTTATADGNYNVLYVTNTHPTVDFLDYQAEFEPNSYIEMYFEGPKGTLPSTAIPTGFPTGGWTNSFIRLTWLSADFSQSSVIVATNVSPTPEPASLAALCLGGLALLRRRRH